MTRYNVTYAQRRFDGPNDVQEECVITVNEPSAYDTLRAGKVYLTASKFGCSRDMMGSHEAVIQRWLTGEHAQSVHSIVKIED